MYITNAEMSASDMVDKYLEMLDVVNSGEARRKNAEIALKSLVACARAGITVKMNDVLELVDMYYKYVQMNDVMKW